MHIYYDAESDYLEIRFGEPTLSSYREIGPDTYARIDKKTGHAIFNVQKGTSIKSLNLEIPLNVLKLLKSKVENN